MHPNKAQSLSLALAASLALMIGGCHQPDIGAEHAFRPTERLEIPWDPSVLVVGQPVAFDITNQRGSVWIEVDDKLAAPEISARASWDRKEARVGGLGAEVMASAVGGGDAGGVVTISGALAGDAPDSAFVDIRVRTPRCDGVRIFNDGGPIVMVGVGGMITAHNGGTVGSGGRIELRTSQALIDPVALVTSRGRVTAVIGPGGRGAIEMDAEGGVAEFETEYGTLSSVRPSAGRYRAVWNDGDNPIIARSADGLCHIMVKPNAEMFSVADDWLALFDD